MVLAGCLLAVPANAEAPPEQRAVTLGLPAASNFMAGFYAADHGLFARHGLDATITVVNEGSTAVAGLMSGSFQFAGPTSTVFLQAVDSGLDLVVAAPGYIFPTPSLMGVISRPDAHIANAHDMIGKKIGLPGRGGIQEVLVNEWLRREGVDPAKVNVVELSFPLMGDALRAGQVDSVTANEPVYPRLIAQHLAVATFDLRSLLPPGTIGTEYAATRAFVTSHPNTLAAVRAALDDAIAEIKANPTAGNASMARLLKMPADVAASLTVPNLVSHADGAGLTPWIELMRRQGLITGDIDANRLIWP
jgi:NitT/TauT family transport system substrate-binding protein